MNFACQEVNENVYRFAQEKDFIEKKVWEFLPNKCYHFQKNSFFHKVCENGSKRVVHGINYVIAYMLKFGYLKQLGG